MLTEEQNPNTTHIDQLSTLEMVQLINNEDAKVAQVVKSALPEIAKAVDAISERMKRGGRLIYAGAGTSGRLGVLDAVECVPTFSAAPGLVVGLIAGGDAALTESVEGAEDDAEAGKNDLIALNLTADDCVVGIAASGRTPYAIGAVNYGNEIGALTVGISSNAPAPLLEAAQIGIGLLVGPEVIAGSTRLKAGTAQKMVLNMISTAVMVKLGKVYGNLMVDVQVKNAKLADRARRIVAEIAAVSVEDAGHYLEAAHNDVKAAIVMALREMPPEEAMLLLHEVDGRLRDVIGK